MVPTHQTGKIHMKHIKLEKISIRQHGEINESWVQKIVAEDPTILGLGDVVLRDKERIQPRAGRLDLLLQDPDTNKRYEVEVQLGATDESHIIRTIEYWDLERKRYPQYDHCAVLIAEDITSRFLNVVSLFNGFIPLIAIQMNAVKVGDGVGLTFTKVIDELALGLVDEDEEITEITDRDYWLGRGTEKTVTLVDKLMEFVNVLDEDIELKYNKFYIGLAKDNVSNNFVVFKPKKQWMNLEIRLDEDDELTEAMENNGLETEYLTRWRRYRLRLRPGEIEDHTEILKKVITRAYRASQI
jgi:hypothetical protein